MEPSLKIILQKLIQFREERDWNKYHDPKNLSQAIGIEAAELQEIFLWKKTDEAKDLSSGELEHLREELADVFIYLMYLCHEFDVDILEAVGEKIQKNALKYPAVGQIR
jgi:NTP pyrophosphatase (non-canonical NTP hydrolase)